MHIAKPGNMHTKEEMVAKSSKEIKEVYDNSIYGYVEDVLNECRKVAKVATKK